MNVTLVYFILHIITYYVLYRSGKKIVYCKTNKQYWKAALSGIIAFSLNEGLRWGRGLDYNLYFTTFNNAIVGDDYHEPLFTLYCKTCNLLGLDYKGFILSGMLLLIISVYTLIKNHRDLAPLVLPLFCIFMDTYYTNLIRWFLGVPFVIFGLAVFLQNIEKNTKKAYVYLIVGGVLASGFHTFLIIIPLIYLLLFYWTSVANNSIMRPTTTTAVFLLLTFLFENEMMQSFANQANVVLELMGDSYSRYSDNLSFWLEGGAASGSSSVLGITIYAYLIPLIYLGYKYAVETDSIFFKFAYNLFIVSIILMPIAVRIELITRIWSLFYFYITIVASAVFQSYLSHKKIKGNLVYYTAMLAVIGLCYSQIATRYKLPDYQKYYVWDSNGEDTQDIQTTYYRDMGL